MTTLQSRPSIQTPVIRQSPFAAPEPSFHYLPQKIADDTYIIKQMTGDNGTFVYVNSMVILGEQPVLVDTGTVSNRRNWFEDVQSLVSPEDVRWIFISHDDHDHTGNMVEALQTFPNATLVTTWFQVERLVGDYKLPLNRMRWVDDGQTFDVGDRKLAAIRPPVYDSPTTRGLLDPKTGVYWASDCFASPVSGDVQSVRDLHPEEWRQGMQMFSMAISPWIALADEQKFAAQVNRLKEIDIKVMASAHTAPINGCYVKSAIDALYDLPKAPEAALPGQAVLDMMLNA